MPEILNGHNFQLSILRDLHRCIVVEPYSGSHNSQQNQYSAEAFFNSNVKPKFLSLFNGYPGLNDNEKSLQIIEEIVDKILEKILRALDDQTEELCRFSPTVKRNIKALINNTSSRNNLKKRQYNCPTCQEFRRQMNLATDRLPSLMNDPLLGAWRFLDPQNNRISNSSSYLCFNYASPTYGVFNNNQLEARLTIFGTPVNTVGLDEISTKALTTITSYYLATKYSCSGEVLSNEEQQNRFGKYMLTLTDALRGYNQDEDRNGYDRPSCPGGTLSRLIEHGNYENDITFMSKKTFVTDAINAVVLDKLNKILSRTTVNDEVMRIQEALLPGYSNSALLSNIQNNRELLHQRYNFFATNNNNENFYQKILAEMIAVRDSFSNSTYHRALIGEILMSIRHLNYRSFSQTFKNSIDNNTPFFPTEVNLIGYALSDPAFGCYSLFVDLCRIKSQQLLPTPVQEAISDAVAQIIASEIIANNNLSSIVARGRFWQHGCGHSDLSIIIGSYKRAPYADETDENFVTRIKANSYNDVDGITNGLGSVINDELPNKRELIDDIANNILTKVRSRQNNTVTSPPRASTSSGSSSSSSNATISSYPEFEAIMARHRESSRLFHQEFDARQLFFGGYSSQPISRGETIPQQQTLTTTVSMKEQRRRLGFGN
jgi:hypothetical protein